MYFGFHTTLELQFEPKNAGKECNELQWKVNSRLEIKISVWFERLELKFQSKVFGLIPVKFFCVWFNYAGNQFPLEKADSSGKKGEPNRL